MQAKPGPRRRNVLRQFFIALSESKSMRAVAERSPMGKRASARFVAGLTMDDIMRVTKELNDAGIAVTMDVLGENVTNEQEARESTGAYHKMLDEITARGLNANVSVKLTHVGFDVDRNMCRDLVCGMVKHAAELKNFVRVDMEGSPYTQLTLDLVNELHAAVQPADSIGVVVQAYLYRSEKDVADLCSKGIRIRLCKGAYKEPADIAFPKKAEVDANYVKLMKMLLKSGLYHGIATHDENMIRETIAFARKENIPADAFEFQMLYGIRRDLQEKLVRDGYRMRVYVPFGTEWYPYFMRRLAERPANVLFIAKNLLRN
jgi:proline dehydrogenase